MSGNSLPFQCDSIAISSIVGYVLGLGDRHCQNILLDEKTAEAIHIDFGKHVRERAHPTQQPFTCVFLFLIPKGLPLSREK